MDWFHTLAFYCEPDFLLGLLTWVWNWYIRCLRRRWVTVPCPLQVCEVGNCPLQVCEEGNCPLSLAGARTGVGAGPDQAGLGGVGVQEAGPHPPAQRRPDGDPGLQEHLVPQDHQLHPRGGQRQEGPQGIEQQSVKVGMIASPRPLLLFCTVTPITSCKKRRPTVRERMVLRTSESLCLF